LSSCTVFEQYFEFLYSICLNNISHSKKSQRDIVINVCTSSCKIHVTHVRFSWNLNFPYIFSKKYYSNIKFHKNQSTGSCG
jgi:hypothetical protein